MTLLFLFYEKDKGILIKGFMLKFLTLKVLKNLAILICFCV